MTQTAMFLPKAHRFGRWRMSPVNFKNDKQRQAAAKGLSGIFDLEYNDLMLDDTNTIAIYVVVGKNN